MSTPLSFCGIGARYGQAPTPQQTVEEQTGWNPKQFFMDYLQKVQAQKKENAKQAEEDALLAMIDAMNASEEDTESDKTDMTAVNSLAKASKAIIERYDGKVNPLDTLTVQALLACLGDRVTFEQADQVQENQEEAKEQEDKEERLDVTEQRDLSSTGDPIQI